MIISMMGASASRANPLVVFDNKHGGQELLKAKRALSRTFYVILILISSQRQGGKKKKKRTAEITIVKRIDWKPFPKIVQRTRVRVQR